MTDAALEDLLGEESLIDDWGVLVRMFPENWRELAAETGAVRRRLREFPSVEALLRVLLIHLSDGCSLRETAARASACGLAAISDVALMKRLRASGAWFAAMSQAISRSMTPDEDWPAELAGRRLRLMDGSIVNEPGATGSTWRLHYALDLATLTCAQALVTAASEGESLAKFSIDAQDIVMADRGYATRAGLRHVIAHKADAVLRINLTNLPLTDESGDPLDVLAKLRTLDYAHAADWPAWVRDAKGGLICCARICAYKKSVLQATQSRQKIQQEAKQQRRKLGDDTLEAAGYVMVLTTLMQPSAESIMNLYRKRWQIELAFKRLKSLLCLGHLRKIDAQAAKAWLQGKIFVACLVEKLIFTGERFSPWGYLIHPYQRAPLTLA